MNGYHSGLLRAYTRLAGGPRNIRWQMYGDQLPGWKSADIELNMTSVTEVRLTKTANSNIIAILLLQLPSRTVGGLAYEFAFRYPK